MFFFVAEREWLRIWNMNVVVLKKKNERINLES